MKATKRNRGFTLVEILIVVVILGILAAIVIPQFTNASSQANENRLRADLQTLRSQIQLYKVQHNDQAPTFATFVNDMTTQIGGLGPYLQQMPVNPFTGTSALDNSAVAGDDGGAWEYDDATGAINADDSGTCNDGVTAHSAL